MDSKNLFAHQKNIDKNRKGITLDEINDEDTIRLNNSRLSDSLLIQNNPISKPVNKSGIERDSDLNERRISFSEYQPLVKSSEIKQIWTKITDDYADLNKKERRKAGKDARKKLKAFENRHKDYKPLVWLLT